MFKNPVQPTTIRRVLCPLLGTASLCVLFLMPTTGWGQITNVTNDQSVAMPGIGHDYLGGLSDIVSPANGSISLRLPIETPAGRGISLPFKFAYNSNGIIQMQEGGNHVFPASNLDVGFLEQGGWTYGLPAISASVISVPGTNNYGLNCPVYTGYVFTAPDGSRHPMGLALANWQTCQPVDANYIVIDQSGDGIYSSWTANDGKTSTQNPLYRVYLATDYSGTVYHFSALASAAGCSACNAPDYIEDRNGNRITFTQGSTSSVTPFTEIDTAGRTLLSVSTFGSSSGDQVSLSEYAQPFVVSWKNTPYNFNLPVTTTGITNSSAGCGTGPLLGGAISGSEKVVSSIKLPNDTSYAFQYDSTYGLLSRITYPNGAYVSYTWGTSNQPSDAIYYPGNSTTPTACAAKYSAPVILHRYVSFDGATVAEQQDFTYATTWTSGTAVWANKTTVVTTTDLLRPNSPHFTTTYVYSPASISSPPNIQTAVANQVPVESSITYGDITGAVLQTVSKSWNDSNQLAAECTTPSNGQTSAIFYGYHAELLVSDKAEYDYGTVSNACQKPTSGSPTRETLTAYHTFGRTPASGGAESILNMPDSIKVYGAGTLLAETDYTYDQGSLASVSASNHDDMNYPNGSAGIRGNATAISRQCFLKNGTACTNNTSVTQATFDETGQPVTVTDANSNITKYSYADTYTTDNGSPATNTDTYLTTITRPTTNGVSHTETFQYGFNDGKVRVTSDENQKKTTFCYRTGGCSGNTFDPWFRLTQTVKADSGGSTTTYSDTGSTPSITITTIASPGTPVVQETLFDQLGHQVGSQLQSDPQSTVSTATTYDGLGRVATVSNPSRTSNDPTNGTTQYKYDSLNRLTLQTLPDNSTLAWSYSGNAVTYTDENGNQWQRTTDGLGRLTKVLEPNGTSKSPSLETDYTYDALDDVLSVTQWGGPSGSAGARTRAFGFDSLTRLVGSSNPEKATAAQPAQLTCPGLAGLWTECYAYDANGNLIKHTDNRSISTTLSYDAINRLLAKSYSDGTPSVNYSYDTGFFSFVTETSPSEAAGSQTNLIGRLALETTTDTTGKGVTTRTGYSYDALGRVLVKTSCTPRTCTPNTYSGNINDQYDMHYAYDEAGDLTFAGNGILAKKNAASPGVGYYYSGLNLSYKGSPQVLNATSDLPIDATHPNDDIATGITYSPLGGIASASAGDEFGKTFTYSPRGWLNAIHSTDLNGNQTDIDTSSRDLHGNVLSQTDTTLGQFKFCYDSLNRLYYAAGPFSGSAPACNAPMLSTSYSYDGFGNLEGRSVQGGAGYNFSFVPNVHNQDPSRSYDAAGNLLSDGVHNYTYDAEGRVSRVDGNTQYFYDAEGRRVAEGTVGQTPTTDFLYDLEGQLVTTVGSNFKTARTSLYAAGKHWADYTAGTGSGGGSTEYRLVNELGSLYFNFDQNGKLLESCTLGIFGESLSCNPSVDFTETHFVDQKRDQESNLDYMGARYYSSTLGRFMSPDPETPTPLHLLNPQRWNMYGYGLNNPLSYTDSGGRDAAAVNFSKEIAIVGHEGIMSVHSDGTVTYARFGPAGGSSLTGPGQVQSFTLSTKVGFDSSGQPTTDSLNAVKNELATSGAEKGQDPSSIRLNYFKTTDAETANLDQWIQQQQDASNRGQSPRYNVLTNNCTMFCQRGLVAGSAMTQSQADKSSIVPNFFWYQLSQEPNATVTSSECDSLPDGSTRCQ